MSNFNQYSLYYDLLYRDKDYKGESDYVIELISEFNINASSIIELGCGTGSHAKYLSQSGFNITGIERSEEMVKEANLKNISNFDPIVGDICNFELNKKFDAAISLFHVISYLTDNNSLINCFKRVNQHLKPNGVFLFDIWFTPAVYSLKPDTRIKRLEDENISILRIAESKCNFETNVVEVQFDVCIIDKKTNEVQVFNEIHPMRHFSLPELELLAKLTGFKMVKSEEFKTKKLPDDKTWGVNIVFKKE
jgi:SAM-dependent methyltransferase